MLRRPTFVFAIDGIAATAAVCNAVKGAGRDIAAEGEIGSNAIK